MKKISLLLFFFLFLIIESCERKKISGFNGTTMGTAYAVRIYTPPINHEKLEILKNKIDSALVQLNNQMSTYIPQSEISRFNRTKNTKPFNVSKPFTRVLKLAQQIHKDSDGNFDVTIAPLVDLWGFGKKDIAQKVPSQMEIETVLTFIGSFKVEVINDTAIRKTAPQLELDFSAIAKGYGVDLMAQILKENGYDHFLAEIGGEVVVSGLKGGKMWQIGIDKPRYDAVSGQELQDIIAISNMAVATSGDYRNYFEYKNVKYTHTINPVTGKPITSNIASVTIIAPNCMLADGLATAVMVMPVEKGLQLIESKDDCECMIIIREKKDFRIKQSSGFESYLKK
jgi:thiamine biosynthesis lipoprotein